jgi:hypothetical protein
MDPIEAFLFRTRKGHCEYFATGLVLMMRTRGIPARIVNGFYATEWNERGKFFSARQSDAHSWVEVWHDELGWLTVDPTPPESAGRGAYGSGGDDLYARWNEFIRQQWQRFVIDYSQQRQETLIAGLGRGFAENGLTGLADAVRAVRDRVQKGGETRDRSSTGERNAEGIDYILAVIVVALFVVLIWRIVRGALRRAVRRSQPAIDYLELLLARLARLGFKRTEAQTPMEFIRSIDLPGDARRDVEWVIDLYYAHRFAGVGPLSSERRRATEIIRALRSTALKSGLVAQ